jgi:hypothetical protein
VGYVCLGVIKRVVGFSFVPYRLSAYCRQYNGLDDGLFSVGRFGFLFNRTAAQAQDTRLTLENKWLTKTKPS